MKASEAGELTRQALSARGVIAPLLEYAYHQIRAAAEQGKSSVVDPVDGLRTPVTREQREAVYAALAAEGYKVQKNKGDDRDPRDRDWVEVSW